MASLICPHCSREYVMRVPRRGLTERLLSIFYIYPFRCQLCDHRFRFCQWGVRYFRVAEDRRDYERLAVKFPMSFVGEDSDGAGTVSDISMKGCTFQATTELSEGSIVRLALKIPTNSHPVSVDAHVRNVRQDQVGVEFLRFSPAEREHLRTFIHGLLSDRRR